MADNKQNTVENTVVKLPAKEQAKEPVKTETAPAPAKAAEAKAPVQEKTVQKSSAEKSAKAKSPAKKVKKAAASKAKKAAAPKKVKAKTASQPKAAPKKAAAQKASSGVNAKVESQSLFHNPQSMEMMNQSKAQLDKLTKEATDLNRQAIEAVVKSTSIFAKGYEEMMRISMNLAQDASSKQTQYLKDAMGSKTFNEWAEVQNKIAQSNFNDFVAGATKISDLGAKTLSEAIEPINTQVSKTVEKASTLMAA